MSLWSPFPSLSRANYDCWFLLVSRGLVWSRRRTVGQTRHDSATMAINEGGRRKGRKEGSEEGKGEPGKEGRKRGIDEDTVNRIKSPSSSMKTPSEHQVSSIDFFLAPILILRV